MMSAASLPIFGVILLLACVCAVPAKEPHPVQERDTDGTSEIKTKLDRIRALLKEIQTPEEDDLKKIVTSQSVSKAADTMETDMRSLEKHAEYKVPPKPDHQKVDMNLDTDDSIQMLAKALASLTEPIGNQKDSDGEKMGSKYNNLEDKGTKEDQITRRLEESVAKALARLGVDDDGHSNSVQNVIEPLQSERLRAAAVNMIESKLLNLLEEAEELGLSVDELIQDLDQREQRARVLRNLEDGLASLTAGRNE